MGRRYKEKQIAASAGRRRPMIQLEGIGKRQVMESPSTANKEDNPDDITGIGLLGAYQEDSDVSDEGEQGQYVDDAKGSKENGRYDEGSKKPDIDDQLAGFLAEINALDTETKALPEDVNPPSGNQNQGTQEVYNPNNFDPSTQWHLLPEPWQTCFDPNSGYYYYWRTDNDVVQWTPPPALPQPKDPVSPSKPVEVPDSAKTEEDSVMIGPQMPPDVPMEEEESDKKDEKEPASQAGKSPLQETSSKGDDVVVASGPLVSYSIEDVYSSDAASDQEEKKESKSTEDMQKQDDGEKMEDTSQQESVKEEESSEETDEDITRKYSLHVSDDDLVEEPTASNEMKPGSVHINVDADSEESDKESEPLGRRVLRKYKKKAVKAAESQKPESEQCKQSGENVTSKKKRKKKRSRDSVAAEQSKAEGKGKFEVDMFAAESLSEGEIKSGDENQVSYKAISPVSDEGSGSSSGSSSSGSGSESDSSESDSEQENKTGAGKVEYEDISSDNVSADVVLEVHSKQSKEEPSIEETEQEKEDKPLEESNLGEAEDSQESEEEMQEFAEMLLEGALGTDSKSPEPPKDLTSKSKATASSTAVIQEVTSDKDVVMKDEPVDDEEGGGPLLKAEVFEHIKKGEKKQVAFEEEKKKATELHRAPDTSEEDYRTMIADTSSTLLEKLGFLDISRKGLTRFQIMLIEMETRLRDWREGALDGRYVVAKLASANEELLKYETTAAPEGWSCHWDSNYKMYYYYNAKTEESTWQYPEVTAPLPSNENPQGGEQPPLPLEPEPDSSLEMIGPQPKPEQPPLPAGEPPDLPGFASPPLPPQQAPGTVKDKDDAVVPTAGASSTDDPGDSKKVIMDPYRARLLKKKQNHAFSAPKPASTDEQISQLFLGTSQPPPPPGEEEMPPAPWDDPISDGTRSPGGRVSSRSASPLAMASGRASPTVVATKDLESTGIHVSPSNVLAAAQITAGSVQATDHRQPDVPTIQGEVMQLTTKKTKEKKEKKRKVATATGLPSKKRKHVSSLVQKWQQVKQKVEEEMAEESSEEEDVELSNLRKIEEWKAQQQVTGMAAYNPNFEEIKGDWRERVKKARQRRGLDNPV